MDMTHSAKLQLLICLIMYAWSVQGIKVTFGTNTGPIVPPTPEPSVPPPEPYRDPAPVWEHSDGDTPDPNAYWRPQPFVPQPRYTHVFYGPQTTEFPLSNARNFVNAYLPQPSANPGHVRADPVQNYLAPRNIVSELSSQNLPGVGLRYFVPAFVNQARLKKEDDKKQDDAKQNQIDNNEVEGAKPDSSSDLQWQYEKDAAKRSARTSQEQRGSYVYQWPAYIPHRQQ